MKLFKSKSGRFVDAFRAITVGNVFFFAVMLLAITFIGSWLLNQIFGTKVLEIGRPLQVIIVAGALTIAFWVVIKRQGALDRGDIFTLIFLLGILGALFYYLPILIPEIFKSPVIQNSFLANSQSPFITAYNASVSIHDTLQSFIPIIP